MTYWHGKRAVITGGSSGLGRALAAALVERGARVAIVARGREALDQSAAELSAGGGEVLPIAADVTNAAEFERASMAVRERWGGVDFFCHSAGRSMRGDVLATSPDAFRELWELNFLSAVHGAQMFAESLCQSRGHLVLIGSLASKVAPRYLGGYPASKFALAALAQQLRLEIGPRGGHVLLVCPGPIARGDAAPRYAENSPGVPAAALRPGGGAKVTAIDPDRLAAKILRACERCRPELIVPARARFLFALSQLSPALGDWFLRKNTLD
jgi:short-subunit dehydrogenase